MITRVQFLKGQKSIGDRSTNSIGFSLWKKLIYQIAALSS